MLILQMMPTGVMPAFDWGSMWLYMVLPALTLGAVLVVIVFFFLHHDRGPQPQQAQIAGHAPPASASIMDLQTSNNSLKPNIDLMGKVFQSLVPTLMDDEKRVMDEIARAGGEVLQSDLPRMTNFSKATISKVIHSFEVRGIVLRERHKWTYWCKINPRLVERVQRGEMVPPRTQGTDMSQLDA